MKEVQMRLRLLWVGILLLVVWVTGCNTERTPVPQPTLVVTPTTLVGTTPISERKWEASPVLAHLYNAPDLLVTPELHWAGVSDVVLYRDGLLLVNRFVSNREGERWLLETARLPHAELCAVLSEIEANGFFDFQPMEYESVSVTDSNWTYVTVRAWREQTLEVYALESTVIVQNDSREKVAIPVGLMETYWLLKRFQSHTLQPYIPERLQVLLYPSYEDPSMIESWQVEGISLETWMETYKVDDIGGGDIALLEVNPTEIEPIWTLLGEKRDATFREGDTTYRVHIRPILPLETRTLRNFGAGNAAQYATEPKEMMDCSQP
jgi:hypothetical protein